MELVVSGVRATSVPTRRTLGTRLTVRNLGGIDHVLIPRGGITRDPGLGPRPGCTRAYPRGIFRRTMGTVNSSLITSSRRVLKLFSTSIPDVITASRNELRGVLVRCLRNLVRTGLGKSTYALIRTGIRGARANQQIVFSKSMGTRDARGSFSFLVTRMYGRRSTRKFAL